MDIRIVISIHGLLNAEQTGSPKDLALKLGISERSVFNYISYMKSELEASIIYNYQKQSYCYTKDCELNFKA
jgi:transcriptional antiterminator